MACCRQEGKDRIVFGTKDDLETPSNAELVAHDPMIRMRNTAEDIKGSDCVDQFWAMQESMHKYPDLSPQEDEEDVEKKPAERVEEVAPTEATATKEEGPANESHQALCSCPPPAE